MFFNEHFASLIKELCCLCYVLRLMKDLFNETWDHPEFHLNVLLVYQLPNDLGTASYGHGYI